MRSILATALLVLSLVPVACSSGDTGGSGGSDASSTTASTTTTSSDATTTSSDATTTTTSASTGSAGGGGGAGGSSATGGGGGAGGGLLLPFASPCTDDSECETGLCYDFNAKGMLCSKPCASAADCPAPSSGCNGMGICKPD